MICDSNSPEDTQRFGGLLGAALQAGDVVALIGPLGAGKTAMVRGIAQGAGVADPGDVNSPTFVIVNEYESAVGKPRLYHIDTYRLRHAGDLDALGFDEMLAAGAVLIEWADRVAGLLPPDRLTVSFEVVDACHRRLSVSAGGPRSRSILDALAQGWR